MFEHLYPGNAGPDSRPPIAAIPPAGCSPAPVSVALTDDGARALALLAELRGDDPEWIAAQLLDSALFSAAKMMERVHAARAAHEAARVVADAMAS